MCSTALWEQLRGWDGMGQCVTHLQTVLLPGFLSLPCTELPPPPALCVCILGWNWAALGQARGRTASQQQPHSGTLSEAAEQEALLREEQGGSYPKKVTVSIKFKKANLLSLIESHTFAYKQLCVKCKHLVYQFS